MSKLKALFLNGGNTNAFVCVFGKWSDGKFYRKFSRIITVMHLNLIYRTVSLFVPTFEILYIEFQERTRFHAVTKFSAQSSALAVSFN